MPPYAISMLGGGLVYLVAAMLPPIPGEELVACDSWKKAMDRLACFETLLDGYKATMLPDDDVAAPAAEEVPAGSAGQAREPSPLADWDSLPPSLKRRFGAIKEESNDAETVKSLIKDVLTGGSGFRVFVLENGQIWQEKNNSTLPNGSYEGHSVTITKSLFGGWRLKIENVKGLAAVEFYN